MNNKYEFLAYYKRVTDLKNNIRVKTLESLMSFLKETNVIAY
jgi:hypothetical protein